jgi:hypothetical protein
MQKIVLPATLIFVMADATGITYVYPHQILERFFADAPLTQDACNNLVRSTCRKLYLNGDSESSLSLDPGDGNFQGAFSYTVKVSIGDRTLKVSYCSISETSCLSRPPAYGDCSRNLRRFCASNDLPPRQPSHATHILSLCRSFICDTGAGIWTPGKTSRCP